MRRIKKLRARPLVAVLALATGLAVAAGRFGMKRRGGERRSRMTETNKAIARRSVDEIFNEGKLEVADELIAPEFVGYDPALPEPMRGPDGVKQQAAGYRAAFSDMRLTIEDDIAEGDRVVTRWTARGTHAVRDPAHGQGGDGDRRDDRPDRRRAPRRDLEQLGHARVAAAARRRSGAG